MKFYFTVIAVLAILVAFDQLHAADEAAPKSKETDGGRPIAAPIHYADITVILSDENGTACVTFRSPPSIVHDVSATSDVVEYQYRFRANDGTESSGEGLVYEKYKRVDGSARSVVDDGGQLKVLAGHFQVEWSKGGLKQGWLYYKPESLCMQYAKSTDFQKLQLSRFAHREQQNRR